MGRPRKLVAKKEPAFLPFVLKAISKLKDHHGSTASKIFDYVRSHLKTPKNKPMKTHVIVSEVQKALEHGVENGLLKVKPGKYTLGPKILLSSDGNTGEASDQNTNAANQSSTGNQSTVSCESCQKRKMGKSTKQSKKQKSTTTQDGIQYIAKALALCDSSPNHTKALRILSRSNSRLTLSEKDKPTTPKKVKLAPSNHTKGLRIVLPKHVLPHEEEEDDSVYS